MIIKKIWLSGLTKHMLNIGLSVFTMHLRKMKDVACKCGRPAVIEIFGEEPFARDSRKEEDALYSDEQQKLAVYMTSGRSQYMNQYINSEDSSFTIIAYPCAAIGPDYKEIFPETVKINTLDYALTEICSRKS